MSTFKELLIENLPKYLTTSEDLINFLDAAGEFLDDIKQYIEDFDKSHDYLRNSPFGLREALLERGYNLPRNLKEEIRRQILRDLPDIIIKAGVEESIILSMRLVGIDPEIKKAWIPSPSLVRKGKIQDPVTEEITDFTIDSFAYTSFLYGDVVVNPDGVFFEGYRYNDVNEENLIGPLPITGEYYTDYPPGVAVSKTPYIVVRFQADGFNVVVETAINPETGEEFEYSTSEEFQLINDVLEYFLYNEGRPTHQRIVILTGIEAIEEFDTVGVIEFYEETHTYLGDSEDHQEETVGVDDNQSIYSEVLMNGQSLAIGEPLIIGFSSEDNVVSPYVSQLSVIDLGVLEVGQQTWSGGSLPELENIPSTSFNNLEYDGSNVPIFPVIGNTSFSITATDTIQIRGLPDYRNPSNNVIIESLPGGGFYQFGTQGIYHGIQIIGSAGTVTVNITYNTFNNQW